MRNTLPRAVLIDVVAGAAVFVGSGALHAPSIIPCFDETFQMVVLAYMALIVMSLTLLSQIGPVSFGWLCASLAAFCAIGLWLGAYHISPSRFGRGGPPIISGFRVTRSERKLVTAEPGREVDIAANSAIETEPISVAGASVSCRWRSTNDGSIDDPAGCDMPYQPPLIPTHDVLRLLAQPECGLPGHVADIKFSVAP